MSWINTFLQFLHKTEELLYQTWVQIYIQVYQIATDINIAGVTKPLKEINPYKAAGPDDIPTN